MVAGIYRKRRRNLDRIGLTLDISNAAINIDSGRKGFATVDGTRNFSHKEHKGREEQYVEKQRKALTNCRRLTRT